MSKSNDGGPAFPIPNDPSPGSYEAHPGMTLRDWFAGQVLAAITVNGTSKTWDDDARVAYAAADAMLAAREATP